MEQIDPASAGMLVVEMQNDLVRPGLAGTKGLSGALATAVAERGVIERLSRLLAACRSAGVRIVYANKERDPSVPVPSFPAIYARAGTTPILVAGTPGAGVVDALAPQPDDTVCVRYSSIDPSGDPGIWDVLKDVQTLIVAGVSTTLAVEGMVRAAANRGLRVVVAEDCCASVPHEWHEFSARNVLPLLAQVATSGEISLALE